MTQEQRKALLPRSLSGLLDETFTIYGRNLRSLLLVSAVINAPLIVLLYFMAISIPVVALGEENPVLTAGDVFQFLLIQMVWVCGSMISFAAISSAVGQQYVAGGISPDRCYARVLGRIVSLGILAVATTILLITVIVASLLVSVVVAMLLSPLVAEMEATVTVIFLACMFVGLVVTLTMVSVNINTVIIEGWRAKEALKRATVLLKENWARAFIYNTVFCLVAFGLSILLTLPYVIAAPILEERGAQGIGTGFFIATNVITFVAVLPAVFIAATLLYFDFRVRKEEFDLQSLANEMGVARG
jgi:hypothetical protein